MKGIATPNRKTRSDKKFDVDCMIESIPNGLIQQLSYVCQKPAQDIGELLFTRGIQEKTLINTISSKFRHGFFVQSTFYNGDFTRPKYRLTKKATNRLYFRLLSEPNRLLEEFCFALSSSKRAAAGLLVSLAILYRPIVISILNDFPPTDTRRILRMESLLTTISGDLLESLPKK